MARIKIDLPAKFVDCISIAVRITDINYGNHLGNDSLVSLLHEARMQWLTNNNFSELDIGGAGIIMSDLAVEYLHEAFYGNMLAISIAIGEVGRAGFELFYAVNTIVNGKTVLIARAKTGIVCFNYDTKRVVPIPEEFKNKLLI